MKTESANRLEKFGITRYQRRVVDIVLFKISWLLLVVMQDAALVYIVPILLLRLLLANNTVPAIVAIVIATVPGLAMDTLLTGVGLFQFSGPWLPSWLVLLWVSFALVLHNGFAFISTWQPHYQALAGAGFGIAGYTAGYLMQAVLFDWSYLATMLVVAFLWALYLPLACYCMRRVDERMHAS